MKCVLTQTKAVSEISQFSFFFLINGQKVSHHFATMNVTSFKSTRWKNTFALFVR